MDNKESVIWAFREKGETHDGKQCTRQGKIEGDRHYLYHTVLGALSILGSLLILGAGGLLLASDNDVGLVLGAAAGVFSVLGAVSGVFYLVIGILGIRNCGRPENCGANFVLGVIVLVLVVIGLVVNVAVSGPTGAAYSVVGLVLSILYLQGAKQNRDAWKAAQS